MQSDDDNYAAKMWVKSRYCNGSATCVEMQALASGLIAIKDSKNTANSFDVVDSDPTIVVDRQTWNDFLETVIGVREANDESALEVDRSEVATVSIRCKRTRQELRYSLREWAAFVAGVTAGDFWLDDRPLQPSGELATAGV